MRLITVLLFDRTDNVVLPDNQEFFCSALGSHTVPHETFLSHRIEEVLRDTEHRPALAEIQ